MIDQKDTLTHHIFFDDNVDEKECIVDVRDLHTGKQIPYSQYINKHVVKVHPHKAILEPDYFIKLVEMAIRNFEQSHKGIR